MNALTILGVGVFFIGGLGILIAAFRTNIWWGLGCLLLAPLSLLFLVLHWDAAKNPFLLQLAGLALLLLGSSDG
ncbi:hypothetical protein [Pseudothauera lacus]|uniref:NADH dehydrogenase subunit 4 n=1 Tax=Pseudothauera lacus TaxID=2136175 RepID=A0A2T4IIW8_9RHOO|nr:hypothetical protein [Pseudothauera lacus]PTD97705.1 hypothetical protein C8261_03245 [Pseudothauera lacus]